MAALFANNPFKKTTQGGKILRAGEKASLRLRGKHLNKAKLAKNEERKELERLAHESSEQNDLKLANL